MQKNIDRAKRRKARREKQAGGVISSGRDLLRLGFGKRAKPKEVLCILPPCTPRPPAPLPPTHTRTYPALPALHLAPRPCPPTALPCPTHSPAMPTHTALSCPQRLCAS